MSLSDFYSHILNLNVDFIGKGSDRHERPHKPIMLLVVMDLIEDNSAKVEAPALVMHKSACCILIAKFLSKLKILFSILFFE